MLVTFPFMWKFPAVILISSTWFSLQQRGSCMFLYFFLKFHVQRFYICAVLNCRNSPMWERKVTVSACCHQIQLPSLYCSTSLLIDSSVQGPSQRHVLLLRHFVLTLPISRFPSFYPAPEAFGGIAVIGRICHESGSLPPACSSTRALVRGLAAKPGIAAKASSLY